MSDRTFDVERYARDGAGKSEMKRKDVRRAKGLKSSIRPPGRKGE